MASSTQLLEFSSLSESSDGYKPLESHSSLPPSGILKELTEPLKHPTHGLFRSSSTQIQAITEPNNTLSTAKNIGDLTGKNFTSSDFVGSSDTQDFYRFSLSTTSNLNLALTGLSADADIKLIQDSNSNNVVDYNEVIKSSLNSGSASESMLLDPIAAGSYYVQVYQGASNNNTNYSLSLKATTVVDNSLSKAYDIKTLTSGQTYSFNNFVGSSDTQDFYRFSLSTTSNLNLALTGLSADADIKLIQDSNSNGVVDYSEVIKSSLNSGSASESMLLDPIAAGSYYVQVYQGDSNNNTNYSLSLKATTVVDNSLSKAYDIKTLTSGQNYSFNNFVGSSDTQDFYRFSLSTTSNLNLSLTGLSADADIKLIQDSNSNGVVDYSEVIKSSLNSGSASESMLLDPIAAGSYYVQVYQGDSGNNTNYSLSLKATTVVDNSLGTAKNIGVLTGSRTFNDFVGSTDIQDFYRFSLSTISDLKLSLTGLSADADVQFIRDSNSNGVVDYNEVLKTSELSNTSAESISYFGLAAGTYYVRVYPGDSGNTNYTLSLSQALSDGFNNEYGYGLVNAAAAIARALGQSAFPNVANLGGNNWGLDMVNAPEAWAKGYTGQGIVVAVIDSGVDYNHSDLSANIWRNSKEIAGNGKDDDGNGYIDDIRGWDFVDSDNNPMDLNNHGTHVAGTIAAVKNGSGVTGVAYNAKIMAVRVLSATGSGSNQGVASGVRYAADNGADVINLSLGGGYSSEVEAAVRYATQKGSVVVMAAGNDGGSEPIHPARHATQWGIAVGAVDVSNKMASFSNRAGNTKMDYIVAPGVGVLSTTPNNTYQSFSGTSMATPHVAGVVALLLSAKPSLTPAQVEEILRATANPSGITV